MTAPPVRDGHVLLVGFSVGLLAGLDGALAPRSVTVIEEPDVYAARRLDRRRRALPCVGEVVLAPYQQADEFLSAAAAVHERRPIDAVIPGLEYGVLPAAVLAAEIGARGAGEDAARRLTDKLQLRAAVAEAGIHGPEWRELRRFRDLAGFCGDRPIVLKPANRQASLGVVLLDDPARAADAWAHMVGADEATQVPRRPLRWRYLAERRLYGNEVSVEALVDDGAIVFENVTAKGVFAGPHPVEQSHVLPATLGDTDTAALATGMRRLVAALGFRHGVLHAEWILTEDGPGLVECAGRAPGDLIFELIRRAYGANPYTALVALLAGRPVKLRAVAERSAAIHFLSAPSGSVTAVDGVQAARRRRGVEGVEVAVGPGDVVPPLRSSWDRCGHVIATGPTASRASSRAAAAASAIRIRTSANGSSGGGPVSRSPER
jgi:biotin carboxylase